MSFDFGRLPFVAVIAWLAFGEAPDLSTWVGAAVIVAASVYIARREAILGRAAAPAAVRTISPVAPPAAHD
jgi:drug/metabolite transporter (DMT)-like permease